MQHNRNNAIQTRWTQRSNTIHLRSLTEVHLICFVIQVPLPWLLSAINAIFVLGAKSSQVRTSKTVLQIIPKLMIEGYHYVLPSPLDFISASIFPVGLFSQVLKSVCVGDDVPLTLRSHGWSSQGKKRTLNYLSEQMSSSSSLQGDTNLKPGGGEGKEKRCSLQSQGYSNPD